MVVIERRWVEPGSGETATLLIGPRHDARIHREQSGPGGCC